MPDSDPKPTRRSKLPFYREKIIYGRESSSGREPIPSEEKREYDRRTFLRMTGFLLSGLALGSVAVGAERLSDFYINPPQEDLVAKKTDEKREELLRQAETLNQEGKTGESQQLLKEASSAEMYEAHNEVLMDEVQRAETERDRTIEVGLEFGSAAVLGIGAALALRK